MTEEQRLNKNSSIKEAMKATHEKRKAQSCSVYKIKIQENKLSRLQKEQLKMLFVEAKWIYNDILNFSQSNNIFDYKLKDKINVKTKDSFESRKLNYIGSQMKQSVVSNLFSSLKILSTLKKNGKKIGQLKFISDYRSIDLKQYNTTYKIKSSKRIKIQNISGLIPVNGLNQLTEDLELANAKILNTPNGYYLSITTYKNKENIKKEYKEEIGIDMGIATHITLSTGEKINASVEETEKLKYLQRKLSRQQKGSNNRRKTIHLIRKEYQYLSNKKNDLANKITAKLLEHEKIYFQDEQLNNWKIKYGKTIQHSILGRLKSRLKQSNRAIILNKLEPTTQLCPICFNKNKLELTERVYRCSCGYEEDRDIHAAKNMILIPLGQREIKPVEMDISLSMKQEDHAL